MNRNSLFAIIFLAVVSLGFIVAGQIFWVRKAYGIQEDQFNDRVMTALTRVVQQILVLDKDSALTEPVQQRQTNFFVANINSTPEPYLLETLLREEFSRLNLIGEFEYGIYDCFTDSMVFGGRVDLASDSQSGQPEQIHNLINLDTDGHYFGVLFPRKTAIILRQLDFWMYSSIVILVIVVFFSYAIFLLLRQKRLSEVKTDFINNMTHELKTPISTIAISAETLMNPEVQKDPERLNQYLRIVRNENERLKRQVDNVLQIATLTPGSVRLRMEEVDLHDVIEKAATTFQMKVEGVGGRLTLDLRANDPRTMGDVLHITNIIYNLLDNALKYSPDQPDVRVRTERKNNRLLVQVSDRGIGIPKAYQHMIFDRFYRVPSGNVHDVKGFGLGLYYVKSVMKALGGSVSVDSSSGRGSTFTLEFKAL